MGSAFDSGAKRIGRKRLPDGAVAILNDDQLLKRAIDELYVYATSLPKVKPRRSIVFRLVDSAERQSLLYKLQDIRGVENFTKNANEFYIPAGMYHVIDSEHVTHICNRHAIESKKQRGQRPLRQEDFHQIPEIIDPRHVVDFQIVSGFARIIYARRLANGEMVLVQEICANRGLIVKTMYQQK